MNDVFRCAERDAHFVRDVRLRRVMCLRAWVEHITSLLRSKNITVRQHNITCPTGQTSLYKALLLCYNIVEKYVDTFEEVDIAYNNAIKNGATSLLEPEIEPWGQRTCYIADPEGNLIEIGSWNKPYDEKDL